MDNSKNPEAHTRLDMWINAFPRFAGATAIVTGATVVIGWILDVPVLKGLGVDLLSMKANTALAFVLAGMSLLFFSAPEVSIERKSAKFLAFLVGFIGLINVAEYTCGWDAGIDQLIFKETVMSPGTLYPGRMSLNTATSFCLTGLALLTLRRKTRWSDGMAQIAALVVGLFGLVALLAYVYGLSELTGYAIYTRMSLHTASSFIFLSVGVLCLQPDVGVMAVIRGEGSGGLTARRLMLAAIGVPLVLGWLVAQGEMEGLYGPQFGDVIGATANIAIFVFLVWTTSRLVNKLDTERKRLERSLLQSEKEFKELFDDAPVGYHELDDEGRIIRINQTELQMLGYRAEEMQGHYVWEFLDDQEASRQSVLAKLSGSKAPAKGLERVYLRKDQTTVNVLSEDRLLEDANGLIIGIRTTLQDITQLKRAEKLLKQSISLLQATLESTADGILVVDKSGRIASYNKEFARMWMLPDDVVESRDDNRALNHVLGQLKDPEAFISKVTYLYANPEESSFDVLEFKNGRIFERYSLPQRVDGEAVGRVWSFRDVTERLRAQKALTASELELRRVWEGSFDGMRVVDGQGTILMVNEAYCTMIGKGRGELVGESLSIVNVESQQRHILETYQERFSSGMIEPRAEREMKLWDGRSVWFELSSSYIEIEGKPRRVLSIFRDVNERKRAEQERETLFSELKSALENVKTLGGLVPICAHCKKIRDDKGYWNQLEKYIVEHTDAKLTHGICPDCAKLYFPGLTV